MLILCQEVPDRSNTQAHSPQSRVYPPGGLLAEAVWGADRIMAHQKHSANLRGQPSPERLQTSGSQLLLVWSMISLKVSVEHT